MIPYINGLLEKIQDAVVEFVEENEDDERTQTFGIDIHISVDVFKNLKNHYYANL